MSPENVNPNPPAAGPAPDPAAPVTPPIAPVAPAPTPAPAPEPAPAPTSPEPAAPASPALSEAPSPEELTASLSADLSNLTAADLAEATPESMGINKDGTPANPTTAAAAVVAPETPAADSGSEIPTEVPTDTTGPATAGPAAGPGLTTTNEFDPQPMPEPKEPTPKEPIKPAAPVPGSIGSAISGPKEKKADDIPDLPEEPVAMAPNPFTQSSQPKRQRRSTVVLLAIMGVLVLAAGGYFVWQYLDGSGHVNNGGSSNNNSGNNNGNNNSSDKKSEEKKEEEKKEEEQKPVASTILTCNRAITEEETLALYSNPTEASYVLEFNYAAGTTPVVSKEMTITYVDETAAKAGAETVKDAINEELVDSNITVDASEPTVNGNVVTLSFSTTADNPFSAANSSFFDLDGITADNMSLDSIKTTLDGNNGFICTAS